MFAVNASQPFSNDAELKVIQRLSAVDSELLFCFSDSKRAANFLQNRKRENY